MSNGGDDMTPEERQQAREEEQRRILRALFAAMGAVRAFFWDELRMEYVSDTGQVVTPRQVRAALDEALDRSARRVRTAANRLREGVISLAEWEEIMLREIKNVHVANAALASGGLDNLTPSLRRRVEQYVAREYQYLQRFVGQVQSGQQRLDGFFLRRSEMYTQAGRSTYHAIERYDRQARGYNQERNILGVAEHCDECLELADRGWVPVGSIPLVGNRQCLSNCRCHPEYRSTGETDPDEFPSIKGTPQAESPLN